MSTQQALALALPAPSNIVVINARCSVRIEADQRVVVVAGLPVHHYRAEDAVASPSKQTWRGRSPFRCALFGATKSAMSTAGWLRLVKRKDGVVADNVSPETSA